MLQYYGGSSTMPHMGGGHIDKHKGNRRIELKWSHLALGIHNIFIKPQRKRILPWLCWRDWLLTLPLEQAHSHLVSVSLELLF